MCRGNIDGDVDEFLNFWLEVAHVPGHPCQLHERLEHFGVERQESVDEFTEHTSEEVPVPPIEISVGECTTCGVVVRFDRVSGVAKFLYHYRHVHRRGVNSQDADQSEYFEKFLSVRSQLVRPFEPVTQTGRIK